MHGEQKTYYPLGNLQTSLHYDSGDLHGVKAMWDNTGALLEEATYDHGKLNGRFFEKMRDGKEVVYHYKNNRREGLHEVYYPSHEYFGKVKALEVTYVNDVPEGEAFEYSEAGVKLATTPYVKGMKEGVIKVFYPKGGTRATAEFHADKQHGPSLQYYPSGKVFVEAHFADDLKEGEEKTYYENGKLAKSIPYKQGQIHGTYKEWTDQGMLTFEGEYKEGKRHGKFNKFYESGKPWLLQTFLNDELHGVKKSYDKDGSVVESKFDKGKKLG
jgi:antitoxin component YwqK of YwqJK toxin-antitoxin module